MSNQSDLAKSAAGFNGDPLSIDTANNRVGVGTVSPSNPITIDAANALGSTFTGTTAGEGIRVSQTSYTADNYVSLIEAPYVNAASQPAVRIGAKFNSSGSSLAFGTSNNYSTGITNTAMTINASGNVGIGTTSPSATNFTKAVQISGAASAGINALSTSGPSVEFGALGGSGIVYTTNSYPLLFGTNNTERLRIDTSGNVLVGVTSSITAGSEGIELRGDLGYIKTGRNNTGSVGHFLFYNPNGNVGSITTSGSSTAFNTSSDHRLKENVTDVTDGITRVKQLEPKRFNFIADPDKTVDGFLAHEAQAVVPEAITGTHNEVEVWTDGEELPDGVSVGDNKLDNDGNTIPKYQGIDQSKLVPLLTAALKEAITKIETLEARLDALEGS